MLTNDQKKMFVDWYKNRYKTDDVIYKTSFELLGITEEEDIVEWNSFLMSILKKNKSNRQKKMLLKQIFDGLWLCYGPKSLSLPNQI